MSPPDTAEVRAVLVERLLHHVGEGEPVFVTRFPSGMGRSELEDRLASMDDAQLHAFRLAGFEDCLRLTGAL